MRATGGLKSSALAASAEMGASPMQKLRALGIIAGRTTAVDVAFDALRRVERAAAEEPVFISTLSSESR